jgi:hypothetical protein
MERITKKLEALKEKPESTRRRIAFITSSSITLVIFLFWVASLGTITNSTEAADTPLSSVGTSLSASASDSFGALKSAFSGLFSGPATQKSSIEVLPGTAKQNSQSNQDNQ